MVLSFFSGTVEVKPFMDVSVNDFIWGIRDNFFVKLRELKQFLGDDVKPFGFLAKVSLIHEIKYL